MAQNQDGYVELIDGVSLNGWNIVGNASWVIGKGNIEGNKPMGFLVSTKSYKNFVIKAEFWAESNTNSGIFIRCQDPNKITAANCYEINIWDTRPEQAYATGAIVDVAKVNPIHKAGGRWNTMEIVANGSHFKVSLNGVVTVGDGQDSRAEQKYSCCADHRFRKTQKSCKNEAGQECSQNGPGSIGSVHGADDRLGGGADD